LSALAYNAQLRRRLRNLNPVPDPAVFANGRALTQAIFPLAPRPATSNITRKDSRFIVVWLA